MSQAFASIRSLIAVPMLCSLGLGCGDVLGGGGGGGGGDGSDNDDSPPSISIDGAQAWCDPTADLFDDLFVFEAATSGPVNRVQFCIEYGNNDLGCWNVQERSTGNWYGEYWADDLHSDCDEAGGLVVVVEAYGEDGAFDSANLY